MTDQPQTPAEAEVLADEQAAPEELTPEAIDEPSLPTPEPEPEEEPAKVDYIEFVGDGPHGSMFIASHTVTRKQLKDAWGITIPKDLEWTKTQGGPRAGRMLVPVSDMTPEAAEGFEKDSMFRRVQL